MSPIIRIDDDVWRWLQAQARPFEDTPNSVLRRVAGFEVAARTPRMLKLKAVPREAVSWRERFADTGRALNERYGLGAAHALFHRDGTWHEKLERFPGMLCDPHGYVWYTNREEFESDPFLRIGEKVNTVEPLSKHPRYTAFRTNGKR